MSRLLHAIVVRLNALTSRGPLKRLQPVTEALDEALLGTDKTAKAAPFLSDGMDIKRMMSLVIIGLVPAALAGIYFYGWYVAAMIATSYAVGGMVEVAFAMARRKPIHEGFLVTGLIFPLVLPPTTPLWIVAVGIFFGTFFGKEVFGGTGRNIFNPALVGRLFVSLAFPSYFATMWGKMHWGGAGGFVKWTVDATTQATPLIDFKGSQLISADPISLLLGHAPGCVGETFRIGILLGGLFVVLTRAGDWRVPVSYLGSVAVSALVLRGLMPGRVAPVWFQLLSGGLMFGAFFMANDPVTSPFTFTGRWVYGLMLGILTVLIRALSGLPESVMFAILLMNAVTPLIDSTVVNISYRRATTKVRRLAA
ncbi:RnfABCDGE type electron transport complex subunit D [candidate division WOR-3 bacterium]|uniref:RnfABCDGE type electron transport complex subunit D n=1 Tax=candidate division WOR-3 bacterium TaxID=2052148 RepID=A0A937XDC5_UNCW3|nr:RnfABCDGE type electron transport complex subunit D [candidate division WOR-3 bacterium]